MIENCKKCPLYSHYHGLSAYVPGSVTTNIPTDLMIIGEAPGAEEVREGIPFCGKSGEELNNYLHRINIPRHKWYITNVVKCRPPKNRDPLPEEIKCCSQNLLEEIYTYKPRVIATMGKFAARFLLGDIDLEMVHGIPFQMDDDYVVIPCYHPATGLHETTRMTTIFNDIQSISKFIKGEIPSRRLTDDNSKQYEYGHIHSPAYLNKILEDKEVISIDTESEGIGGKPWCVTFSVSDGEGYLVLSDDYECLYILNAFVIKPWVQTIMHNAIYDIQVLETMGITPKNVHCTLVMAYLLQSESLGLKPLAYRYLSVKMKEYEDVVKSAQIYKSCQYLLSVTDKKWLDPDPILTWDKGRPHVKQPQNIRKKVNRILNDFSKNQELNIVKRWNDIGITEGRGMVERELGKMPITSLADIPFTTALEYACKDAITTLQIFPLLKKKIEENNLTDVYQKDISIMKMVNDMQKWGIKIDPNYFKSLSKYFQERMDGIQARIEEYYQEKTGEVKKINPQSTEQIAQMLYEMGIFKFKKQSTAAESLDRVRARHPVINKITEYRGLKKLKGTYSDTIIHKIDANNRVHSTIRTTRIVTGRLSFSDPNLTNQPVRSEDGKKIRQGFIAEEGCVLLSGDYSQIEMRMAAHCSQDKTMLRMFNDNLDIHSETASWIFNIPIDKLDPDRHRYPAKRIGFGILYALSAIGLQKQLLSEDIHYSLSECQMMLDLWYKMYQGIADYMEEVKAHARRYGWVADMFGRRRLVPEVLSVHEYISSAGLRQAVNAPIQMGAQGVIKRAMCDLTPVYLQFEKEGYICRPLIQIHDDLVFEVSEKIVESVAPVFKSIMENAVQLSIPVTVDQKVGKNWKDMEKLK